MVSTNNIFVVHDLYLLSHFSMYFDILNIKLSNDIDYSIFLSIIHYRNLDGN